MSVLSNKQTVIIMKRIIFLTLLAGLLGFTLNARNTSESINFRSAKKAVLNLLSLDFDSGVSDVNVTNRMLLFIDNLG